ncbi:RNA polymerase I associated factor A49-like protein [Epithele typhae]|uniref:RNA polymerase I associated factor A49-like protein n=1 Tax=Epithele typhae TaxID=378194 RepID=UPI0020073991|nr:RNA polymerase I associated factor A49-like protein [Epithele typhae]KAH9920886.1 RNA polymerase I associated factor A49-like protein [Epithele typhae]
MSSSTLGKKRKRGSDDGDQVALSLSELPASQVGPVLGSFPSTRPPSDTPFRCYAHVERDRKAPFELQHILVAGEAEKVDFSSADVPSSASSGCSYMVAVHDKRTKITTFRPAPLHILARQVKALKNLQPIEVSTEERMELRNNLGEAFGTKKAKSAIRARERNRVDIDAMKDVAGHLQDTIMQNTETLPTAEEAKEAADSSRLVPPYNAEAQRPQDVYPINSVVPEVEFNALPISSFKSTKTHEERRALLPFNRSDWVNWHLRLMYSAPKPNKTNLKLVYYISTMMALLKSSRSVGDKDALQQRLTGVPSIVIDGLLSRFTEKERGTNKAKMTPQTETMLLTYMFALCLRIDDYAADFMTLARDLSMQPAKANGLFKSLGCTIKTLAFTELKEIGLPDSEAETKRAVLKVPLEFPKTRQKRGRR